MPEKQPQSAQSDNLVIVRESDLRLCLEAASSYETRIPQEGHNEWAARLREASRLEVTDEMVERVARRLAGPVYETPLTALPENRKAKLRELARAALSAALGEDGT